MNGVEFLSSKKVVTKTKFNWKYFWLLEITCSIVFLCAGLYMPEFNDSLFKIISMFLIGIFFGVYFSYLLGLFTATPVKYAMEYKVAILDEAAIPEIREKYEIVEQDGKLWTIREEITE